MRKFLAQMRVVQLAPAGGDTSCLQRWGGTLVSKDLPDTDVRAIEVLIRKTDQMTIIWIKRLSVDDCAPEICGEIEVSTGVACGGPMSGGGNELHLRRVDGSWRLIGQEEWHG